MTSLQALKAIKGAINDAPRNGYIAEIHLQVIKYADVLQTVTGREFCEEVGLGSAFGTEFSKMKKIAPRLKKAGLDPSKL